MSEKREYEKEYKVQAVKLAKKIGSTKAAEELQIPVNTLYGWIRKAKKGRIGHRMRRTQSRGISEHCRRKSAAKEANKSIGKRKQTAT